MTKNLHYKSRPEIRKGVCNEEIHLNIMMQLCIVLRLLSFEDLYFPMSDQIAEFGTVVLEN